MADREGVSGQQERAIELLLGGLTQREAASQAGVAEETVSRWMNGDAEFVAALNRRREELWRGRLDRLRGLADAALDVYAEVLQGDGYEPGERRLVARDVLRSAVVLEPPPGDTDARDVAASWETSDSARELTMLMNRTGRSVWSERG